jgi:hypothetical protein
MDMELEHTRVVLAIEGPPSGAFEQALQEAETVVEETAARAYLPFLHEIRAERANRLGDAGTRERELREAERVFREMGAAGHADRLTRELERL